ncbi:hypothetical protein ACQJBY_004167 [Aegilops geniculata]
MSEKPSDETTGQVRPEGDVSDVKVETANQNKGNEMPSAQQEEAVIKKKYGGVLPKKSPLISKDHERAYFDSADWALGKEDILKSLKARLKHFDRNYSLPSSKPVHADSFMHLLTATRVPTRLRRPRPRTRSPP